MDPLKRTHGLQHAGGALNRKHDLSVYLDFEDVTRRCICADDELNFVVLSSTKVNAKTGKPYREIRFGDVQIFACEKVP